VILSDLTHLQKMEDLPMNWAMRLAVTAVILVTLASAVQAAAIQKGPLSADEARRIIDHVDRLMRADSSRATTEMVVTTKRWTRSTRMTIWSKGTDNVLIRVEEPKKDAGTATLRVGNNIWNYLPGIDRTVRVPTSMMMGSWMGSHFTNDDLVKNSRLIRDYDIDVSFEGARDGAQVYEFSLTPKPDAPVVWGRVVYLVRQADLLPVWARFYAEDGALKSTIAFTDAATLDGHLVPTRMRITPQDKPGEFTEMRYVSLDFDVEIPPKLFSLGSLRGSW
jgi:outer membrane lipoprotein-sorting protein